MRNPEPQVAGLPLLMTVFVAAVCGLVSSSLVPSQDVTWRFSYPILLGHWPLSNVHGRGFLPVNVVSDTPLMVALQIEFAVGLIGGSMAALGFAAFAYTSAYIPILTGLVCLIGVFVGMEIPLVIRILQASRQLDVTLAQVMSLDYIGAFLASLAFSF